jgi:hypothetical protein
VPNPDLLAAFAAQRTSDNALKWQLTSANTIARVLPDISYTGASFTKTLPPQSITLFVVRGSGPTPALGRSPPMGREQPGSTPRTGFAWPSCG